MKGALLLLPKKWYNMIWNNHDGPFSTLLNIGHMTGWISNMTYV